MTDEFQDDDQPQESGIEVPLTFESPESSTIAGADYDPLCQMLVVRFKSGASYVYTGFPQAKWDAFQAADSKGGHFSRHIRPLFEGSKQP